MRKYWGYDSFRPLQEDIIHSVLEGKDTLALLPTGGGKSICFQVPAMAKEGVCIVVSPLISLIRDQVENLRSKGIIAVSIHSGMHAREIDIALDYCVYGKPKFLFLSPERLETELFKARVKKMKVNLLAIDESHCISQWGYDFRPSYLKISEVRKFIPGVPVMALTATATPDVVKDIQDKLEFKDGQIFYQSFARENLIYVCRKTDNKIEELKHICLKLSGTGIVYVRNRRRTVELAQELVKAGITASAYHAGLSVEEREKTQQNWKKNTIRVVTATNAFGMGIDKPDVRFVIHFDLPDSPEAYYQEAGRGGRDGKNAYAVILYNANDLEELNYFHSIGFPEKEMIRKVYLSLGNFFKLAVGSGENESFVFSIEEFCKIYPFKPIEVLNAMKILSIDRYIELSDAVFTPSRLKIEVDAQELYSFQIKNPVYDSFIKLILRKYTGLFEEFVRIREAEMASILQLSLNDVRQKLNELNKFGIIKYIEQTDQPFLTFIRPRVSERDFTLSKLAYDVRKQNASVRIEAIRNYVSDNGKCRNQSLLAYFNEFPKTRCGKCDVCITLNKLELSNIEFERIATVVMDELEKGERSLQELNQLIHFTESEKLSKVIEWMVENQKLILSGNSVRLK